MLIHVHGKNSDIDNEFQQYVEAELTKLNRFAQNGLISSTVSFTGKASRAAARSHRAEIVLFAPGRSFHSEENGGSFEAAFEVALDKLKLQLKKLKDKRTDKLHDHPGIAELVNADAAGPIPASNSSPRMVVEKFNVKPMTVQEAMLRLNQAKRDFFVFYNGTNQVHCLYKRADGKIGLLVPETELTED